MSRRKRKSPPDQAKQKPLREAIAAFLQRELDAAETGLAQARRARRLLASGMGERQVLYWQHVAAGFRMALSHLAAVRDLTL